MAVLSCICSSNALSIMHLVTTASFGIFRCLPQESNGIASRTLLLNSMEDASTVIDFYLSAIYPSLVWSTKSVFLVPFSIFDTTDGSYSCRPALSFRHISGLISGCIQPFSPIGNCPQSSSRHRTLIHLPHWSLQSHLPLSGRQSSLQLPLGDSSCLRHPISSPETYPTF
ncbi:hypothetical protein BDZ97DRAFT_208871 [Flammula alnicola]|nr:hypothetical protein BDZ97DRAFT_208871 [Flammula alnicola]